MAVSRIWGQSWLGQRLESASRKVVIAIIAILPLEQVKRSLDPRHPKIGRERLPVAQHVVEPDILLIFEIQPLFVSEDMAER